MCRWGNAGSSVEDLIEHRDPKARVPNLSPSLQKKLCAEYAAVNDGLPWLESLVLPVGRPLRSVDFVGVAGDSRRIVAQVTHYSFEASPECGKHGVERMRYFSGFGEV